MGRLLSEWSLEEIKTILFNLKLIYWRSKNV
jgi:hypothetical protein